MLVYLGLPHLSWTFRRPCFGQMVPPSSVPAPLEQLILLFFNQMRQCLMCRLYLSPMGSQLHVCCFVFLVLLVEGPVSAGPSSHNPTGNLLLPTMPDKPYLPTSNKHRMREALLTEHAGFSMLFRVVLIPPLSKASPNSPAVLSLRKISCCRKGPDSDATWLLLNSNGGSE